MRPDRIMRKELVDLVNHFKEEGINFKETPPLFRWQYTEFPELLFELLITEPEVEEVEQNAPATDTLQ